MASATATKRLMTTEELLALPDDGVERYLIRGELREIHPDRKGRDDVTIRNRHHCRVTTEMVYVLRRWLDPLPHPRGRVYTGEVGVRLRGDPETTVGIDVVYVSADTEARQTRDTTLVDGVPVLAVEIMSPSTTFQLIEEKVEAYLDCGVPLVWVVNPSFRTVTVHRPGAEPLALDARDTLSGDPELPGFSCPVADLFR